MAIGVACNFTEPYVPVVKLGLIWGSRNGDITFTRAHGNTRIVTSLVAEKQSQRRQMFTLWCHSRRPNTHAHGAYVRQAIAQVNNVLFICRDHDHILQNWRYFRPHVCRCPRVLGATITPAGSDSLTCYQILEVRPAMILKVLAI